MNDVKIVVNDGLMTDGIVNVMLEVVGVVVKVEVRDWDYPETIHGLVLFVV